jgi:hypothetical protein
MGATQDMPQVVEAALMNLTYSGCWLSYLGPICVLHGNLGFVYASVDCWLTTSISAWVMLARSLHDGSVCMLYRRSGSHKKRRYAVRITCWNNGMTSLLNGMLH